MTFGRLYFIVVECETGNINLTETSDTTYLRKLNNSVTILVKVGNLFFLELPTAQGRAFSSCLPLCQYADQCITRPFQNLAGCRRIESKSKKNEASLQGYCIVHMIVRFLGLSLRSLRTNFASKFPIFIQQLRTLQRI